jgi:hypothetical protein
MRGLYFILCIPLGLMLIALVSRATRPPERRWSTLGTSIRIALEVVAGIILLVLALRVLPGEARTSGEYAADWGCRQGTRLDVNSVTGMCSVQKGVVRTRYASGSRGSRTYYFTVSTADGLQRSVIIPGDGASLAVWNAADGHPETPARVQLVNGRITLVTTDAGTATTQYLPQVTLSGSEVVAAFGVGLVLAGILEAALAALLLPAGW